MRQHFPQSSEKDEMLEKVRGQARPARLSPLEREQTHQHTVITARADVW